MKKVLFVFALLFNAVFAFAFDVNMNFGIEQQKSVDGYQHTADNHQQQKSVDGYQQYVGKSFFVRPAFGKLETWKKSGFEYDKTYDGKTFTISKVTVKDVTLNDKPNKEITVMAVEDGGKKKIKFNRKIYNLF